MHVSERIQCAVNVRSFITSHECVFLHTCQSVFVLSCDSLLIFIDLFPSMQISFPATECVYAESFSISVHTN